MITSIFSKSKPINAIMVAVFVVLVFLLSNFSTLFSSLDEAFKGLLKLLIAIFSLYLLSFIVSKNTLSKKNSYAVMTFGLLFGLFPNALNYIDLLLANLFVLFALRRLISLHSNLHLKKKFFDAGFWIMMASLFYFWAILFFALVIVALIYHSKNDVKNIIIPFVGLAAVIVILLAYNSLVYDTYVRPDNFERYASLDFTFYNNAEYLLKLTVFFSAFFWATVYFFRILPDKNKKLRPSLFLVVWWAVMSILIAIIAPLKNGCEFLFLFGPFSVIMANYIEVISERWFKEVFVIALLVVPLISLML